MKRLTNIVLFAVAMLLGSCDRESLNDQPPTGEGEVQIKLALAGVEAHSTRATEGGTSEEDAVNTVQLVIFNNATGAFFDEYKFPPADPKPIGGVVWDSSTQTVTLKDILTIGTAYDIYVVANAAIANASTSTSAAFEAQILANTTLPLPAPTTASGLVMTGKAKGHTFANLGTVLNMNLTRVAAKIQIKVVFDPAIATKLPNITFDEDLAVRILNVPNQSYYYTKDTAFPTSATLIDPQRELTLKEGVSTLLYMPENATKGGTAMARESATQFILNVPFTYKKGGIDQRNPDNYYLLNINNSNVDPYEIVRNTSYNVTVTVNSLGDKIPTISGTTIKTVVQPWTIHEMSGEEGNREEIELSNTSCDIYGDQADNILVGTVKMKTEGMTSTVSFSTEGTGFTLATNWPTTAKISYDTPAEIRIKTTENITGGKVHVTVGKETKTIIINRNFDHQAYLGHVSVEGNLFTSDAEWCTLSRDRTGTRSTQNTIINSRDPVTVYINALKSTLGDKVRMANIMVTKHATTDIVKRIVVVQQPYVTSPNGVQWATGNICLDSRPDLSEGNLCYVIGAATESTLFFMFNKNAGFTAGEINTDWNIKGAAYKPTGMGPNALVIQEISKDYAAYKATTYDGDPCKSVYSSDPKIKWRLPTKAEFEEIKKFSYKWTIGPREYPCIHRGSLVFNNTLYLPAAGSITKDGKYIDGALALPQRVSLWSSGKHDEWSAYALSINSTDDTNLGWTVAWASISQPELASALGVRCVRIK